MKDSWVKFGVSLFVFSVVLVCNAYCLSFADLQTWESYVDSGISHFKAGQYEDAEADYNKALIEADKPGMELEHKTTVLNCIATLYSAQGKFDQAEKTLIFAIESARKHGEKFPFGSLITLAQVNYEQGKYDQAEKFYLAILPAFEKLSSTAFNTHLHVIALNQLGLIRKTKGDFQQAEDLYKKAVLLNEENGQKDSQEITPSLHNLASLYIEQKRYKEAEALFNRVLEIDSRTISPTHPSLAMHLNNLGSLYLYMGQYNKAEPLLRRSLDIGETNFGKIHPTNALALNNLGFIYSSKKDYLKALSCFQTALEIQERTKGNHHIDTAQALSNVASSYYFLGNKSAAKPLFEKALLIFQQNLSPDHASVKQTKVWLSQF